MHVYAFQLHMRAYATVSMQFYPWTPIARVYDYEQEDKLSERKQRAKAPSQVESVSRNHWACRDLKNLHGQF
jgi:hypothetical protein